jgi:hypothetical protein
MVKEQEVSPAPKTTAVKWKRGYHVELNRDEATVEAPEAKVKLKLSIRPKSKKTTKRKWNWDKETQSKRNKSNEASSESATPNNGQS